ncbi:hypothetical protein BGX29_008114, partial [Mortierella sp. GBA35]
AARFNNPQKLGQEYPSLTGGQAGGSSGDILEVDDVFLHAGPNSRMWRLIAQS